MKIDEQNNVVDNKSAISNEFTNTSTRNRYILIAALVIICYFFMFIKTSDLGILLKTNTGKMNDCGWYMQRIVNQQPYYAARYLQQSIIGNLILKSKKEFDEQSSDKNINQNRNWMSIDRSQFHTGFSTLSSHNCPVVRPNYVCGDLHDNRFENYTISFEYQNNTYYNYNDSDRDSNYSNNITHNYNNNYNYTQYFSSNIESKFLRRLFNNGGLFDTKKDMTIVIWGNSYLRQITESISCMLHQFDFTPLKFFKYSSNKNKLQYNDNGYMNKHNFSADIRMSTFKHSSNFQPCFFQKQYWPKSIFKKFHVPDMESFINNYTDWGETYSKFYLDQLKNGQNMKNVQKFFANLSESDLKRLAAIVDTDMNHDDHVKNDELMHQIDKNMVHMYQNCFDGKTHISLFNNKTQKRNDIFYISSNDDSKNHSLINALTKLKLKYLTKWKQVKFEQLVNKIDVIVLNFGNEYSKHHKLITRYNLIKLQEEYKKLQSIRSQQKNYKNIPIIIANPWGSNYMNQTEWKKFETNFVNKYKLPIVHYSLWDVINKSSMTYQQLEIQRSSGTHYCMPGASIKYAFTFFEMIEMLTMQIQS